MYPFFSLSQVSVSSTSFNRPKLEWKYAASQVTYSIHPLPSQSVAEPCCLLIITLRVQWLAMVLSGWRILTAFSFHTNLNDQEQKINSMKSMALLLGFWFLPREGGKERRAGLGHVGESSDHGRTGEKEKCRPRWGYIIGSAGGLVPEAFQSRQRSAPMFDRR